MEGSRGRYSSLVVASLAELQARRGAVQPIRVHGARAAARLPLQGVPMHWMRMARRLPVFVQEAKGRASSTSTGSICGLLPRRHGCMTGHARADAEAVTDQSAKGMTLMLPSEDALWVAEELTHRLASPPGNSRSPPRTPIAAIRLARHLTGRSIILVFAGAAAPSTNLRRSARTGSSHAERQPRPSGRSGGDDPCRRVQRRRQPRAELYAVMSLVLTEPALQCRHRQSRPAFTTRSVS